MGLGGPKAWLCLSSLPTLGNPQALLSQGLAPLPTVESASATSHPTPGDPRGVWAPSPTTSPRQSPTPGPSPVQTSGVGHDLGLLWMDSEREELERHSAFLAVLRGTPARVAGAGSENFGVQRPGDPGGRSRSKEKIAYRCGVPTDGSGSKGQAAWIVGGQALHSWVSFQKGESLGKIY